MQTLEAALVQFNELMNKIQMMKSLQEVEASKGQNQMSHSGKQVH